MRLISLARFKFGLLWPSHYPRINWRLWIDAVLFVALMISVYSLVDYITRNAALSDRAVVAERQQIKAEVALAHCLNGKSLDAGGEGFIQCEKAFWVKL